jgi:hypothetical protein
MPPEGTPEQLRAGIARGREEVIGLLTEAVRPGLAPGREPPDPALVARWMSTIADEAARLLLTRPDEFGIDRALVTARWLLAQL